MNRRNMDHLSLPVRRYRGARNSLLLMMIMTVINTVLAAVGSYTYFVFSDYLSYYLALFGRVYFEELGEPLYLIIGCVAAAIVLLPYLLCWIFSKKRRGWLIAALVLFIIDTLLLVSDAIAYMDVSYILDIAFHIWLIVELIIGIRAGKAAIAEMTAPPVAEDTEFHDASTGEQPDTKCLGAPQEERKHRVLVEAQYGGRTIEVRRSYGLTELVIDGRLYGTWEGVAEHSYDIVARVDGHEIATRFLPTGKQTIEVDGEVIAKKQRLF